ncbi:glycosyltransferase family 4 protein [Acinetobacter sp. ANC 3813]|uniref:glycosyltransferase family 4 protein n=1 Tax=Acinetobacter sp. ANC 3813 TaxID=1977873 RepID=UPI000A342ACC|nr:glycosyltransferase family 1 protein [Acinetobacter sp. ANC 3813]OTG89967.1 glycosyl transferase [Acinetobacter sp. ANC 3813]
MEQASVFGHLKQQNFPENFKFYIKNKNAHNIQNEHRVLNDLVRPKLKIALVTETWPPEINGVALSLLQLCKGLQQQGHKILLIRPQQKSRCSQFSPNKECLVMAQAIPRYPSLKFGWPQFMKVTNAIDEFAPDVVHIVTEGPLGLAALQAAKVKNIPVSSGFHSAFQDFSRFFDLAFLIKPVQHYLRWFHNNTQLTCVPSRDTAQSLQDLGVHCPMAVVGRGVDVECFHPQHASQGLRQQWGADEQTRVLLYVGRLSPEKELNLIVSAYAAMHKSSEKKTLLVIVGDGPEREKLQRLGNSSNVIFMGSLSGISLSEAYASADAFVFASQVETFGNVVLEAMASGLPVVAYDYACAEQHVRHLRSGWLSKLGDAPAFIRFMQQLPERQVLKQMGHNAREDIQDVGWQYPVQQFEQALYYAAQAVT